MSALLVLTGTGLALLHPSLSTDGLVRVSASGERAVWYVDESSVERSGNMVSARVVVEHWRQARVQRVDDMDVTVDCRSRLMRPLTVTSFAPDGEVIARRSVGEAEVPASVAQPRTPAGSAASHVCGDSGRFDYNVNSALQVSGN